jgi:hypothetical protein
MKTSTDHVVSRDERLRCALTVVVLSHVAWRPTTRVLVRRLPDLVHSITSWTSPHLCGYAFSRQLPRGHERCERRWLVGSNRPRHAQSVSSPSPIRVTEDHAAMTPAHLYRLDLRLASDALSDTLLYRLAAVAGIQIN